MSQTVVTIDVGGTGANNANAALTNLGALPTFGGSITGNLNVSNNIVVTGNANLGSYVISGNSVSTTENNGDVVLVPQGTGKLRVRSGLLAGNGAEAHFDTAGIDESTITLGAFADSNGAAEVLAVNKNSGTLAYSEFIALNDSGDQDSGWISIGVNSSNYNDPEYTLTGPDDGYILYEAAEGTSSNGDLIIGTGSFGLNNKIVMAAGGFTPTDAQLIIAPADLKRANLVSYVVSSNVVTFTTDITHTFVANDIIIISSVGAPYDGTRTITGVTSNTLNVSVTVGDVGPINLSPAGSALQFLPFNKGTVELTAQLFVGENSRAITEEADITLAQGHAIPLGIVVTNDGPGQTVMINKSNGALAYSEYIAHNDTGNVEHGWISIGINSSNYDDPEFPITKADDGYILYEPPEGTTGEGDLIIGTGTFGSKNRLIFAAEGFDEANAQMIITPNESVRISIATDSSSVNTGALQVVGGVGVQGSMYVQGNQTIQGDLIVNGSQVIQSIENLAAAGPISLLSDGNIANTWDQGLVGTYALSKTLVSSNVAFKEIANNTATITTDDNHSFVVEDYAAVANVDVTFNGTHRITAVTANTFSFYKLANNVTKTAATGQVTVDKAARYTGVVKRASDGAWRFFSNLGARPEFNTNFADANLVYDSIIAGEGTFNGSLKFGSPNTATISYSDANNRTFTIPAVSGNRTFAFINEAQTFTAAQAFSSTVTATKFIPTAGDATGNGLYLSGTNTLGLSADGVERVSISASGMVVNDGSADYDFRVESDGNANMLFIDGGNNRVGIGTGAPISTLQVSAPGVEGVIFNNESGDRISFTTPNRGTSPSVFGLGTGQHAIVSVGDGVATNLAIGTFSTGALVLGTANTERARITSSGDVGIGTTNPSAKLHVVGNIRSESGSFFGGLSTVGGRRNTVEINNYFKIGTWRNVNQADRLNLRIIGSASYSAGLTTCGETLIMLSFVNNNTAEGTFYSTGKHANITNVAVKTSADGSNYQVEVWVTVGNYGSTAVIPILAGGYWDAADVDTGSGSLPAGATALTSTAAFFTAGTERLTIDASGNVGIGSVSPGALLNLHAANPSILLNTTTDNGTTALVFNENGSNAGRISVSGDYQSSVIEIENYSASWANTGLAIKNNNVGIGTATPQNKLHVLGSSYASASTANGNFRLQGDGGNGLVFGTITETASYASWIQSGYVVDFATATYNLLLQPLGGNVGIGTTTPSAKLDIAVSSTMGTYGPGTLNLKLRNTNTSETNSGAVEFIGHSGNATTPYPWATISAEKQTSAGDSNYGGKLHLWTTSGGANGEANSGQYRRLTIDSSGNVGIGTTSPGYKLHVEGTQYINSSRTSGTNVVGLTLSDNVTGIQTTGFGSQIRGVSNGGAAISAIGFEAFGGTNNDTAISFYTQSTAGSLTRRMIIDAFGNVGIGTTSPGYKLQVVGGEIAYTPSVGGSVRLGNDLTYGVSGSGRYVALGFGSMVNGGNRIFAHNNGEDGIYLAAATGQGVNFRVNGSGTTSVTINSTGLTMTGTLDISTSGMKDVIGTGGSGTYYSNTWYTIADKTSLPTEGMYVVIAFVDTYAAGGGFYYMKFGSVPFYWYPVTSNGAESYELPAMIGTGHAANAEPPPKIRVRQTYSNAGTFVEFQPGANWTGLNNVDGGKIVRFYIRRIA